MLTWLNNWLNSLSLSGIYLVILVLTAIIYKTAFAVRLPVLKTVLVYITLAIGCWLLAIFHLMGLPIVPALLITVVLIAVTRLRLYLVRKKEQDEKTA